jgi:hypothetical protein
MGYAIDVTVCFNSEAGSEEHVTKTRKKNPISGDAEFRPGKTSGCQKEDSGPWKMPFLAGTPCIGTIAAANQKQPGSVPTISMGPTKHRETRQHSLIFQRDGPLENDSPGQREHSSGAPGEDEGGEWQSSLHEIWLNAPPGWWRGF